MDTYSQKASEVDRVRRLALAGTIVLSLTPLPSQAASSADQAVEQFHRLCLAEGPSFERMILTADDPDWEPIAEAAFAELAPIANPASVRVWLLTEAKEDSRREPSLAPPRLRWMANPCRRARWHSLMSILRPFGRASSPVPMRRRLRKIAIQHRSRVYILIAGGREQFVRLVVRASKSPGLPVIVVSSIMAD